MPRTGPLVYQTRLTPYFAKTGSADTIERSSLKRLSGEKAIERVTVMERQPRDVAGVPQIDRQRPWCP